MFHILCFEIPGGRGGDSLFWDVWLWDWAVLVDGSWERVIWHHEVVTFMLRGNDNTLHGQIAWRGRQGMWQER